MNSFYSENQRRTNTSYSQSRPTRPSQPRVQPRKIQYEVYQEYQYERVHPPKRNKGGGAWLVILVLIIAFILIMYMPQFDPYTAGIKSKLKDLWENRPPLIYREYPETLEFTLERTFTIACLGNDLEYSLILSSPLELADNSMQDVLEFSSTPNGISKEGWVEWSGQLMSGKTANIIVKYHIITHTYIWRINTEDQLDIDAINNSLKERYLHDEWFNEDIGGYMIAPNSTDIIELSEKLTEGKSTVYDKLKSIFSYMRKNFRYVTGNSMPQDALTTLAEKSGDCDDQSILFISLCRAAGIPAWLELGLQYDSSKDSWGGHAWTQVVVPTKKGDVIATIDVVNGEFLARSAYKFADFTDEGDGHALAQHYTLWTYSSHHGTPNAQFFEDYEVTQWEKTGNVKVRAD